MALRHAMRNAYCYEREREGEGEGEGEWKSSGRCELPNDFRGVSPARGALENTRKQRKKKKKKKGKREKKAYQDEP